LAQRINLAFVSRLLPLGFFQKFQHQFHLIQRITQIIDDDFNIGDRLAEGGRFGGSPGWRIFDGSGAGGGRLRPRHRCRCRSDRRLFHAIVLFVSVLLLRVFWRTML